MPISFVSCDKDDPETDGGKVENTTIDSKYVGSWKGTYDDEETVIITINSNGNFSMIDINPYYGNETSKGTVTIVGNTMRFNYDGGYSVFYNTFGSDLTIESVSSTKLVLTGYYSTITLTKQ